MQNHISLTGRVTPHFDVVTFDLDVTTTWPPPIHFTTLTRLYTVGVGAVIKNNLNNVTI